MGNIKNKIRLSPSIQICLGFITVILIGAFLLCLPVSNVDGNWLGFLPSLFTSTSAVCVTGLTVVEPAVQFTLFGQIILLLLIQIGGLGIIAVTSLILLVLRKKISFSNRLTIQESLNKENVQGVVKYIKKILIVTFSIELIGMLLILYSTVTYTGNFWTGLFVALFLAISSFCNAGFDILGTQTSNMSSLGNFSANVLMLLPIMFLIVLGGIGFIVILDCFRIKKGKQHNKVVIFITTLLILIPSLLFMLLEWNNPETLGNMSVGEKILNSFFQSITTRTAGFATINQGALSQGSQVISMILMMIGGSPNSTAGGIKTTTLFLLILFVFRKTNERGDITFKNKKISNKIVLKMLKIVVYVLCTIVFSVLLISIIEPQTIGINTILFECVSAISTTGLSMGITTSLSAVSQLILIALMYVGRVGLTTVVLAISAKSEVINDIEYTNTDIIIG